MLKVSFVPHSQKNSKVATLTNNIFKYLLNLGFVESLIKNKSMFSN